MVDGSKGIFKQILIEGIVMILKKMLSIGLLTTFSVFSIQTTLASGDWGCGSNFSLVNQEYNSCAINFPMLDTGNDTQTNLYLLLADEGFIDFKPQPITKWTFPFELEDLRTSVVNQVKNPRQNFVKPKDRNFYNERCGSYQSGLSALNQAMEQDKNLTIREKKELLNFRQIIAVEKCIDDTKNQSEEDITQDFSHHQWSEFAQGYADYIIATDMFYQGNFIGATELYRAISQVVPKNTGQKWLVETAKYMLIRTAINQLYNSSVDSYGFFDPKKVELNLVKQAHQAVTEYFQTYADGRYVASARGLLRRIYWLSGQQERLIQEIEWQLANPKSPQFNLDFRFFPEEVDRKIFGVGSDEDIVGFDAQFLNNPILLAVYDLQQMRPKNDSFQPISLEELKNQEKKFNKRPELYRYLLASHYFYVQFKPDEALQYLPTNQPTGTLNYFEFSRYVLKARILEQLGKHDEAKTLWQTLNRLVKRPYQQEITQLALAIYADKENDFSIIFGKNAKVTNPVLLEQIIMYSLDEQNLQKFIEYYPEKDRLALWARFILLYKTLRHQQYDKYLVYLNKYLPTNIEKSENNDNDLPPFNIFNWQGKTINSTLKCNNLSTTINKLSQNPQDRLQKFCLTEFLYDNSQEYGLDGSWAYYYQPNEEQKYKFHLLGLVPSRFSGQVIYRHDLYQQIFSSGQKDELSAYALHRAISCYASSGNNQCGGKEVEQSVRKGWFNRLKKDFAQTTWAKKQKYYW